MMVIGIAASNTWPTFSPKYAAAALKMIAINIPQQTDHKFTSRGLLPLGIRGSYSSPVFNSRNAFSGS